MKSLYKYLNGNCKVSIYEDGTKIRKYEGIPKPEFPESIDLKITNMCDLECKFCHENSVIDGKHGNFENIKNILNGMSKGTEIAIGGGNPLVHPKIIEILKFCKEKQLIPNMTINYLHIDKYIDLINYIIDNNLVYGIGISYNKSIKKEIIDKINNKTNIVFHLIVGIHNLNDVLKLKSILQNPKILFLGYKHKGRGKNFFNSIVEKEINTFYNECEELTNIKKGLLSFDNLALEQTEFPRFFSQKYNDIHFMGEEGQFTFYINSVDMKFAQSSTEEIQFDIKNKDIKDMFKFLQH